LRAPARNHAKGARNTRHGFTLVELIVVIVILGILAAIAVPALTGYIAKAEDKEFEMQARDIAMAAHSVIDEAYGNLELSSNTSIANYVNIGTGNEIGTGKFWYLQNLSYYVTGGDYSEFTNRVSALMGKDYSAGTVRWYYFLIGPTGTGSTALNADGFLVNYYPEGTASGKPFIAITYKVSPMELASGSTSSTFYSKRMTASYDPNAGYEVYHLVQP
jgi:prepilin-type N-terminal cleavage/methylation domain-containing protein